MRYRQDSKHLHKMLFSWMTACGLLLDDEASFEEGTVTCGRCKQAKAWDKVMHFENGFGVLVEYIGRNQTESWQKEHGSKYFPHHYTVTIHYPFKVRTQTLLLHFGTDDELEQFIQYMVRAFSTVDTLLTEVPV